MGSFPHKSNPRAGKSFVLNPAECIIPREDARLFAPGNCYATTRADRALRAVRCGAFWRMVFRHERGDWGEVSEGLEVINAAGAAHKHSGRIESRYIEGGVSFSVVSQQSGKRRETIVDVLRAKKKARSSNRRTSR